MSTIKVEYVGVKPEKIDNVAGTGKVWHGQGDVQEVSPEAWAKLKRHPDIWRIHGAGAGVDADKGDAKAAAVPTLAPAKAQPKAKAPKAPQVPQPDAGLGEGQGAGVDADKGEAK